MNVNFKIFKKRDKKMRVRTKRKKEYQDILSLLDEVHKNCEKPEKNKKAEQMEKRINTLTK